MTRRSIADTFWPEADDMTHSDPSPITSANPAQELVVGAYRFDRASGRLTSRGGVPLPLGRRAAALLAVLAEQAGCDVAAPTLLARVWPGQIVDPANVAVQIAGLRTAIGDTDGSVILTVHGRGYRLAAPAPSSIGNIPHTLSPLIGRGVELANVVKRVRRDRLLVITGLSGSGKSRLASTAAQAMAEDFPDGRWLVPLTSLPQVDADTLSAQIVLATGLNGGLDALRGRECLLLLDGAELLDTSGQALVRRLVEENAGLHILVTSHLMHPLLRSWCVRLSPLIVADDKGSGPANALFVEAANAAGMGIAATADTTPAITQICNHLGGLPLGVEIGARAASMLGLDATAEASRDPLRALPGIRRHGPGRHRNLGAAMDWALGLLTNTERLALTALAALQGEFTTEQAASTLSGLGSDMPRFSLSVLYEKSVLDRVNGQYMLHPLVRAGALAAAA